MYNELQTHTTRYIHNMLYIPVLYAIIPRATAAASTVSNVEVLGPGVTGTGEKAAGRAGVTGANGHQAGVTGPFGRAGGRAGGLTRTGTRMPGGGGTTVMPWRVTGAPGVG